MTSEEKVKLKYPDAVCVKMKSGKLKYMQRIFYIVYDSNLISKRKRLGDGDTKASAYKDALSYTDFDATEYIS